LKIRNGMLLCVMAGWYYWSLTAVGIRFSVSFFSMDHIFSSSLIIVI